MIILNVEWDNANGIRTLKEKVESVNFPVGEDEEYKDDSNEILKSIDVEDEEESDGDSNMEIRFFVAYLSLISIEFILVKNLFQTHNCLLHCTN